MSTTYQRKITPKLAELGYKPVKENGTSVIFEHGCGATIRIHGTPSDNRAEANDLAQAKRMTERWRNLSRGFHTWLRDRYDVGADESKIITFPMSIGEMYLEYLHDIGAPRAMSTHNFSSTRVSFPNTPMRSVKGIARFTWEVWGPEYHHPDFGVWDQSAVIRRTVTKPYTRKVQALNLEAEVTLPDAELDGALPSQQIQVTLHDEHPSVVAEKVVATMNETRPNSITKDDAVLVIQRLLNQEEERRSIEEEVVMIRDLCDSVLERLRR